MFFEPKNDDHGLPFNPFKACVVPRPIGWIISLSHDGIVNLAPFSISNQLSYDPPFVFLEGPPFANAPPGVHHVLVRIMKDAVCRYKTMTGHYVRRKAGWDTHGLPVEYQVEKQLNIRNKQELEAYGVEKFIEKCKENVFQYEQDWRRLTEVRAHCWSRRKTVL